MNFGELRSYAIGTGWYETFIRGAEIYLRIVTEAARAAGYDKGHAPALAEQCTSIGFGLWREIILSATAAKEREKVWGSQLSISAEANAALRKLKGVPTRVVLGVSATDHQRALATSLRRVLGLVDDPKGSVILLIGPPAFNPESKVVLCQEDVVRLKYEKGLAGLAQVLVAEERLVVLVAGLSDFGDGQLAKWTESLPG
jgi:hypothetical protein